MDDRRSVPIAEYDAEGKARWCYDQVCSEAHCVAVLLLSALGCCCNGTRHSTSSAIENSHTDQLRHFRGQLLMARYYINWSLILRKIPKKFRLRELRGSNVPWVRLKGSICLPGSHESVVLLFLRRNRSECFITLPIPNYILQRRLPRKKPMSGL